MSSNLATERLEEVESAAADSSGPPARRRGPSPFLLIGLAFVAGVVLAKMRDWRNHAERRG